VDPGNTFSVDSGDLSYFLDRFCGAKMGDGWAPPKVTFSNSKRKPRDFVSWMPCVPVVSEAAKSVVESIAKDCVEFLPIFEIRGRNFYAMNVTHLTNALDRERSDVEYFDDDSLEIMRLKSAVFSFGTDEVPPVFKVQGVAGDVYVNRRFAELVRENALSGAIFINPETDVLSRIIHQEVFDDFC
jgi:hypothetical protein